MTALLWFSVVVGLPLAFIASLATPRLTDTQRQRMRRLGDDEHGRERS
jgi:hypothetical protein